MVNDTPSSDKSIISKFGAQHGGGARYVLFVMTFFIVGSLIGITLGIIGAQIGTNAATFMAAVQMYAVAGFVLVAIAATTLAYIRLIWAIVIALTCITFACLCWFDFQFILWLTPSAVRPFMQP